MKFFSYFFLFSLAFVFVRAQLVCPGGGLLDNFNQDDKIAKKCLFVIKIKAGKRGSNPIREGNDDCKAFGGPQAGLAQPETSIENEILRYLLEEDQKTDVNKGRALLGIAINKVELKGNNIWVIYFNFKGTEIGDYYNGSYEYRYKNFVGEVGFFSEHGYSYFLQSDSDNLNNYVGQSPLCTTMNPTKGNWEVTMCDKDLGKRILCQSNVFPSCTLPSVSEASDYPCTFNKRLQACTRYIADPLNNICPPNIPTEIYCEPCDRGTGDCEYSEWTSWTTCVGDCKFREKLRFKTALNPSSCQDVTEHEKCDKPLPECPVIAINVCDVGDWTTWTTCSAACGERLQTRSRSSKIITGSSWSSEMCDKLKEESKNCAAKPPCEQNCIQEVSEWSECSANCGFKGTRTRSVKITVPASGKGMPCSDELDEENCPDTECM